MLEEFIILNNFEIGHIKMIVKGLQESVGPKNYTCRVHALIKRVTQNFVIWKFCNEHTCDTSGEGKDIGKLNLAG